MSFAFLPLYTGDYRRDTMHLTPLKHGIYLLLLMYCWDQKGPAPLDETECAGICNCRSADEIDALRYVLDRFFTRVVDGFYNERMNREVERANALSDRLSTAGRIGARKRKSLNRQGISAKAEPRLSQGSGEAKPLLHTPTPTTTPTTTPRKTPKPPGFDAFWSTYPHYPNRSSKAKSWERWVKMSLEPIAADVMTALRACLDIPTWTKNGREFVCAAEVWLNKRLWEQELISLADRLIESITADPRFADMNP